MATANRIPPIVQSKKLSRYSVSVLRWQRALILGEDLLSAALARRALLMLRFTSQSKFNSTGQLIAYPGRARLLTLTGRTHRTLRDFFDDLKAAGVLKLHQVGGRGARDTTQYAFVEGWLQEAERKLAARGALSQWPDKRLPIPKSAPQAHTAPDRPPSVRHRRTLKCALQAHPTTMTNSDEVTAASVSRAPEKSSASLGQKRASTEGQSNPLASKRERLLASPKDEPSPEAIAALEIYQPSAKTVAYLSEHCADVADPHSPRHVEKWRNWCLARGVIPKNCEAHFRSWMLNQARFESGPGAQGKGDVLVNAILSNITKGRSTDE